MHDSGGHFILALCYLILLLDLSIYEVHRYTIVYLFLKHRKNKPVPLSTFTTLPKITVQLPIFNEYYVVERLLKSVSALEYPRELLQIQVLDDSTDDTSIIAERIASELKPQGFNIEVIH